MQNIFPYWTGKETQARRLAQKLRYPLKYHDQGKAESLTEAMLWW
jgi:hypothetical protein